MAANLIANLDRTALDLETKFLDLTFKQIIEDMSLTYFAKFGMTMFIVAEMDATLGNLLIA